MTAPKTRGLLVLLFALLSLHLLVAGSSPWTASTLSFDGFRVIATAVNQNGTLIAVAYGDSVYYRRFVDVYTLNLTVLYRLQPSNFSDVALAFLDNSTLIVTEYVMGSVIPYSYVHLIDLRGGVHLRSPKIPGTDLTGLKKAIATGSYIYLLTEKYLVGFTRDLNQRTYLKTFRNTGLQVVPLDGKVLALSIETLCHICLEQNEKVITLITPGGEKNYTLYHVLSLVNLPSGNIGIVYDNLIVEEVTLSEAGITAITKLQLPILLGATSEPDYKLLYGLSVNDLEMKLAVYNLANRILRSFTLPLPYAKGDKVGVRVYDSGTFAVWNGKTVVLGNLSGVMYTLDAGFAVRDVYYSNNRAFIVGSDRVLVFQRAPLDENYTLVLDVVSEDGEKVDNFTLKINGETIGVFSGSLNLTLKGGVYNITVTTPNYVAVTFPLNLTSNTRKIVTLHRVRYPLIVHASTTGGDPAEIVVYRGNVSLARGVGYLEVRLLPGNYTVVASYGNVTLSRTLSLSGREEITVVLNATASQQKPSSPRPPAPTGENSTLTVVVYGEETCPECRRTRELLGRIVGQVYFRDIANQTFLQEYDYLYQMAFSGYPRIVPLTLVFKGKLLHAVVAGSLAEPDWRRILGLKTNGSTLVVTSQGEWMYRSLNSTEAYLVAVRGFAPASPVYAQKPSAILPLVVALAAADSINPCTFMVFAALVIAIMGFAGRRKATVASAAFISAVYICYFLLGLGLIKFISFFNWLRYIIAAAVIAAGAYSLAQSSILWREGCRDTSNSLGGAPSLMARLYSLSASIFQRINEVSRSLLSKAQKGSVVTAFLAGVVVSFTLLPCSSGPYLVAAYMLAGEDTIVSLLLLMLYNAVFVLPLVLIAAGVIVGGRILLMVDVATIRINALRRWTELALGLLLILLGVYIILHH
ncbi:hypothetical protein IG193_03595 [Infirmifilum lucidum]|uniref:Uncharacterized protein n=1 Tax=Infirmifilum lucidum TaxID=2776706 RepID=A0A7L9FKK3_9CREN|nr:hypothetical protein [Infirmifilum lucidum]QOJ79553.1 hypothetical protein IG193_03595 [Infirmifilum lucidum]